jgi:beta-glucosidase
MGRAVISPDGSYRVRPDVAVVVFGEQPYAEFQGDVADLLFRDEGDHLALLQKLKSEGIKTVSVFLSGRPLWVNQHINASDAFVAAWLPGSEGGGVADVLFGKYDFRGKLSFSWPKLATQYDLNVGNKPYDPLFAFGYGLRYAHPKKLGILSEDSGLALGADLPLGTWFARGKTKPTLEFYSVVAAASTPLRPGSSTSTDALKVHAVGRHRQEDSRRFVWTGGSDSTLALSATSVLNLSREASSSATVEVDYKVDAVGDGIVKVLALDTRPRQATNGIDVSTIFREASGRGWQKLSIPLSCFAKAGVDMSNVQSPLALTASAPLDLTISRIALGVAAPGTLSCRE